MNEPGLRRNGSAQNTNGWGVSCALLATALGCSAGGQATLSPAAAQASAGVTGSTEGKGSSTELGKARLEPDACEGYDTSPEHERLSVGAFQRHLDSKGLSYEVSVERGDLHVFDVDYGGRSTPLRVATLKDRHEAGRHLHDALLEHGQGYWGVHRSNLAVLGPPGSSAEAIGFAVDSGLACWGVLTLVGRDDSFVVPGGYYEL